MSKNKIAALFFALVFFNGAPLLFADASNPWQAKMEAFQKKQRDERAVLADRIQGKPPEAQIQMVQDLDRKLQAEQKQFHEKFSSERTQNRDKLLSRYKQKNAERYQQFSREAQSESPDRQGEAIQKYLADKKWNEKELNEKMKQT